MASWTFWTSSPSWLDWKNAMSVPSSRARDARLLLILFQGHRAVDVRLPLPEKVRLGP